MNGLGRQDAPFSGRVWQEIDRTVCAVRTANGTVRRFVEVDGPYGPGLTSVVADEGWLEPNGRGADHRAWNVPRPEPRLEVVPGQDPEQEARVRVVPRQTDDPLDHITGGTFLVRGVSRPVPLIASEFFLGIRAVEAFETGCQPLDLCRAAQAARDVALEEERLLYYGYDRDDHALLRIADNTTPIRRNAVFEGLHRAIGALARRGYAGPFALVVEPPVYSALYSPVTHTAAGEVSVPVLLVDLLRNLFRGGVYLAPVIDPERDPVLGRIGAVVTVGPAYLRLVVGQNWATGYRGRDGVHYRFLIQSSLQLRICDPRSIQVLLLDREGEYEMQQAGGISGGQIAGEHEQHVGQPPAEELPAEQTDQEAQPDQTAAETPPGRRSARGRS
jgi:uncharacterized linocin/CFP29 family protein